MKTGQDVWERALYLLNYTDQHGRADALQYAELFKRALPLINQIYADLWFSERQGAFRELAHLTQPLQLSPRLVQDVMPYGVAMLLAQTESDGDSQQLFAALYNQKRAVLCGTARRRDVLPTADTGCGV